jgi:hypothetical protein
MNNSFFSKLIKAWLFVGTMDITAATIQVWINRKNKDLDVIDVFKSICRYIASAIFGPSARTEGNEMVVAGLVFHYTIALLFTVLFFILFSKLRVIIINRLVTGIVYGVFVWAVMNRIVVPLSAIGSQKFDLSKALVACGILVVCIGIPLAMLAPKPERK